MEAAPPQANTRLEGVDVSSITPTDLTTEYCSAAREASDVFAELPVSACPPRASGIYLLWSGRELVYVGMSTRNIRGRVAAHMLDSSKVFDFVSYCVMPCEEVRGEEAAIIRAFRPRYNIALPKGMRSEGDEWHADE